MFTLTTKRKAILGVFSAFVLLGSSVLPAAALFGGLKIPSASSIAGDLEKRYNLDLETIQDQGQLFNVAQNKQPAPEVTLFFTPTDPRPGEKITARAFTTYFSSTEENLYFTWYLKRSTCDLTNSPSASEETACDRDGDGRITVEDWKAEAMRILAQNGFNASEANTTGDNDNDGYRAPYGGHNRPNGSNYCYIQDRESGENFELADAGNISFSCPSGTTPVCMIEDEGFEPGTIPGSTAGTSDDGETFVVGDTNECSVSGLPACGGDGVPTCGVGTPRCVANPESNSVQSCGSALTSCRADQRRDVDPYCTHLFPNAPGDTTGDGSFGLSEETYWGTNPNDPDTADLGQKDEATLAGLGHSSFTWNYDSGDRIGVVVEGPSMIATKHEDSSAMIMWAFSKNDCPLSLAEGRGAYEEEIKGYSVQIETADMDLNRCLERNLVDPTEGGQATNLELQVSATPDNPLNDESGDKAGDLVIANASVSNGRQNASNTLYEWNVEISNNIQFSAGIGPTADVTDELRELQLLGNTSGNALSEVRLKLNIPREASLGGRPLSSYLVNDVGYLRFTARASENFANNAARRGRSDVIVKFVSSGKKIVAYKAEPVLVGEKMRVELPSSGGVICNDDALDRSVCRVVQNEVIGLSVEESGLSNYSWSVNGSPLVCTQSAVSPDCNDGAQGNTAFLPITGEVGSNYNVTLTANDVESGRSVTLTRNFTVITPEIRIVSPEENVVWPKLLGQYRDITGTAENCPEGLCSDYSRDVFQAYSGDTLTLEAEYLPSFIGGSAERAWTLDAASYGEANADQISFDASKAPGGIYTVTLAARTKQSDEIRRALYDTWGVSPLNSSEIQLQDSIQVELLSAEALTGNAVTRSFAALVSYLPSSLLFTLRVALSGALILFASGFLLSALPAAPGPSRKS